MFFKFHRLNPARTGFHESFLSFLALIGLAMPLQTARAEDPKEEIGVGTRVLTRSSRTDVKVRADVVATLNAGSTFRVERVQGDWLWMDSGNLRGWVKSINVVRADRAVAVFSEAIAADPDDADAYVGRGIAHLARKNPDRAIADFTRAIELEPERAWAYHDRAVANYDRGDFDRALADTERALKINPDEASHWANRASVRFALKRWDEAIADYSEALNRLKGNEAIIESATDETADQSGARLLRAKWTCARAECWVAKQAPDRAVSEYEEAAKFDENDVSTMNSLAWLRATSENPRVRDGLKAYTLANRACESTGFRNHLCLDTLAAAYAAAGDFAEAVKWQTQALALAGQDSRITKGYRARLELFSSNASYYETPSR